MPTMMLVQFAPSKSFSISIWAFRLHAAININKVAIVLNVVFIFLMLLFVVFFVFIVFCGFLREESEIHLAVFPVVEEMRVF